MKRFHSLVVFAALAAAACSGNSSGTGRVTVKLTDAASPTVLTAVVTISKISLQGDSGETVLTSTPSTVSLLSLANETATLVQDAVVPPGTYQELRFQITGGYIEVPAASGTGTEIYATSPTYEGLPEGAEVKGELKMPSYSQSGLKVTMPASALVVSQDSKIMLVDFDVSQSFGHDAGNSGSWVMHPVIKGVDFTMSGNLVSTLALGTGVTLPTVNGTPVTLGNFSAVLTNETGGEETLPYTDTGNGTFAATFKYLLPGPYTVEVEGTSSVTFTTDPASPVTVTVPEGGDAHADFTITSAAPSSPQ
jgi:hypothetical protein